MKEKVPNLEQYLRDHNLRATTPRRAVFEALQASHAPLMIGSIVKSLPSVDRVSIYRTLELFVEIGIATIIMRGWKRAYELKSPFAPHHHHLECANCGTLVDIKTPELEALIDTIAEKYNFRLTSHHIELTGICDRCNTMI